MSLGKRKVLGELSRSIESAVESSSDSRVTAVLRTNQISQNCNVNERTASAMLAALVQAGVIVPLGSSKYHVAYRTSDDGVLCPFLIARDQLKHLSVVVPKSNTGRVTDMISEISIQIEILIEIGEPQNSYLRGISRHLRKCLRDNFRELANQIRYTTKIQRTEILPPIIDKIRYYDSGIPMLDSVSRYLVENPGGYAEDCRIGVDSTSPKSIISYTSNISTPPILERDIDFGEELSTAAGSADRNSNSDSNLQEDEFSERNPALEVEQNEPDTAQPLEPTESVESHLADSTGVRVRSSVLKSGLRRPKSVFHPDSGVVGIAQLTLDVVNRAFRDVYTHHSFRWDWDHCPPNLRKMLYDVPVWRERDPNPDVLKIFRAAFAYYYLIHGGRGPAQSYLGNPEFTEILFKMRTASVVMRKYYEVTIPNYTEHTPEEELGLWKNWLTAATEMSHHCMLPDEPLEVGGPFLREYNEYVLWNAWESWNRAWLKARDEHNLTLTVSRYLSANMAHIRNRERLTFEDLYGEHAEQRALREMLEKDDKYYIEPKGKSFDPETLNLPLMKKE